MRRRRLRRWAAGWLWGAGVGLVAVALSHLGLLEGLNLAWLDALLAVGPGGAGASQVKVVAVGDQDFQALGLWPPPGLFPRQVLARAVDALARAKPRVLCLDLLLDIPAAGDDQLEAALQRALSRRVKVILACGKLPEGFAWPLPRFTRHAAVACADIGSGPSSEARVLRPVVDTPRGPVQATALAACEALGADVSRWARPGHQFIIHFRDDGHPFARYALADVLAGAVPEEWLRGAVVLLGREDAMTRDVHRVPLPGPDGTWLRPMYGVEVQACAVDTLLSGRPPVRMSPAADAGLVVAAAALLAWLVQALGVAGGSAAGLALVLVVGGGASVGVFRTTGYMVNLAPVLVAVVAQAWVHAWRERRAMGRALGPLVGQELLRRLDRLPELAAGAGQVAEVAVMTFDVRGSTRAEAEAPPEQVGPLMNRVLGAVGERVVARGGMVNKFLGDGLLALFAPVMGCEQAAEAAVAAALDIAASLPAEVGEDWAAVAGARLRFGLTVHFGAAWLGFLGMPRRLEFTAIGDVVNVAFKMQDHVRALGSAIMVSRRAAEEAGMAAGPEWSPVALERPDRPGSLDCLVRSLNEGVSGDG